MLQRLAKEFEVERVHPGSPIAQDAEIHVYHASLHDVPDRPLQQQLKVPTALTMPALPAP